MALLDIGADFTLSEKTEGHIGFFGFKGDRDVDAFTGDFGVFSNIITDSKAILFTAWLQHSFDHSQIRFGQLASDESFYVSETGSLFINANFGAIPTVSANVSAPIFSVGAAGLEWLQHSDTGYWQIGAYAGDPGPGDEDDHGFKWKAGGEAGYFMIAEKAWNYQTGNEWKGVFKIGAYYHSGRFESFAQDTRRDGNHAFYAIVDQTLADKLSLFARVGINPKTDRSVVSRFLDLGFNWSGLIENRPNDTFGIAYSHTEFSKDYLQARQRAGDPVRSNERVFEMTYAAGLAGNWIAQPSLQWILNAHETSKDALVAGIRVSTDF